MLDGDLLAERTDVDEVLAVVRRKAERALAREERALAHGADALGLLTDYLPHREGP